MHLPHSWNANKHDYEYTIYTIQTCTIYSVLWNIWGPQKCIVAPIQPQHSVYTAVKKIVQNLIRKSTKWQISINTYFLFWIIQSIANYSKNFSQFFYLCMYIVCRYDVYMYVCLYVCMYYVYCIDIFWWLELLLGGPWSITTQPTVATHNTSKWGLSWLYFKCYCPSVDKSDYESR